ncbi:Telomerase reverse transcriptase [Wickerhamomyces ciferrii]|uniref:Telomerase reverse transcriptase n=1 Tax=Wickerhamomyces ciferrii (strain ATCC 14091 / BCRC 22168 / CBS 111 / JCM 3599 / NBRC 0793 / NRRL Y-1031 F-60-10) TaxID=1206466 RepID=K0KF00_WICCF|nr:Telomerase reverse transcriptase [Wickerhamomyces ciferrii]CCH40767.1 Telomerase reverse transcriptase [Wickerhamomyces ciferrii]
MCDNIELLIDKLESITKENLRILLSQAEITELDSCYVQLNTSMPLTLEIKNNWSFDKLIDQCREFFVKHIPRCFLLGDGYKVAKDSSIGSSTYSDATNGACTLLKGRTWRRLHSVVGNDSMCYLLLNFDCFVVNSYGIHQIFGRKLSIRNFNSKNYNLNEINLNSSLYTNIGDVSKMNPIPHSKKEFFQAVFKDEFDNNANYSKLLSKHKPFSSIISKIQCNHKSISYFNILSNICNNKGHESHNVQNTVSKSAVFKFCTIVFEKVFPVETYGSKQNKKVILRNLGLLIMGKKGDNIKDYHLMKNISLKHICWLGKGPGLKWNKQDFQKRYKLFKDFQVWLFNYFFCRLLGSFFHITNISSSKELLYYVHLTWGKISRPFVNQYKTELLSKLEDTEPSYDDGLYTKLTVMPKKNDSFRAINKPLKGNDVQSRDNYMIFLQKKIKPTRHILAHLRMSKESPYPKLASSRDIPLILKDYKNKVGTKYEGIYYLKFDVKDCYDNLPKDLIFKLSKQLVETNKIYFVNHYEEQNMSSSVKRRRRHFTMESITPQMEGDRHSFRSIQTGSGATYSMGGDEILSIIENQLDSSYTIIGKNTYRRREGIFQGLHLSSVFCDIVYDEMIECEFSDVTKPNSLILRLADDFLILSTDKSALLKFQSKVENGFPDFGAVINKEKTFTNLHNKWESKFTFCGFDIDIDDFKITKTFEDIHILNTESHKALTRKLLWIFGNRLSNNTFDLSVNNKSVVTKEIFKLVYSSAKTYVQAVALLIPDLMSFRRFFEDLIEEASNGLGCKHHKGFHISDLKIIICSAFLMYFEEKNTRFLGHIQYLQKCIHENAT